MHECRLQQRKRMGPRVQTIPLPNPLKKRQCTTPHPLSGRFFLIANLTIILERKCKMSCGNWIHFNTFLIRAKINSF